MAKTVKGDVHFNIHEKPSLFRFEVSVTSENTVVIWIEDRESKKQWQTEALELKGFVTNDNAIPKATASDYAERFAACLRSNDATTKYEHELAPEAKGGLRTLKLTVPLQWGAQLLAVGYKFALKQVPLERVDILGARLRDVEELMGTTTKTQLRDLEQDNNVLKTEVKTLQDRVEQLELGFAKSNSPVFAQATAVGQFTANQTIAWAGTTISGCKTIQFETDGRVRLQIAGTYSIHAGVLHSNASNGIIIELKRGDTVLRSCQGSAYNNFSVTPLHYILVAEADDEICTVYKGSGYAHSGSYLTVVKL